eukprot:TRINITY_DN2912_c0_g2_i1.p1 TRINITY_DN2912_c0_g2~~TRINITY_DN2912_c0_g2_i1.p1  ORF type:complete len:301 (+),score=105.41 TRINITY_DN2912_c0_g2_i1:382-1284(+)
MTTVYCLGLLIVGFAVLTKIRRRLSDPDIIAKFRFLYDGYVAKRYFWELVIMMRKLLVAAIIVFGRSEPLTQLYAGCWMVLGALILHLYARPFSNKKNTNLESLSLTVTVITLMNGMLFFSGEIDDAMIQFLSILLVILNSGTIIVFITVLVQLFIQISKRQAMILKMQQMIAKQYDDFRQQQEENERLRMLRGEDESASFRSRAASLFRGKSRRGSTASRFSMGMGAGGNRSTVNMSDTASTINTAAPKLDKTRTQRSGSVLSEEKRLKRMTTRAAALSLDDIDELDMEGIQEGEEETE